MKTTVSLWKRPANGVYYAVWQAEGQQKKRSLKTKDRGTARSRLNNFRRELSAGKIKSLTPPLRHSFFSFCDHFLESVEHSIAGSTYRLYRDALQKARASWGDLPMAQISSRHVDIVIGDMLKAGLKGPTVNKNIRHLKAALKTAYRWDYLAKPIIFPKMLKTQEKLRYLTREQLQHLVDTIDDPEFQDLVVFAALTGLRRGEILRLTWRDIDKPRGYLRISSKQKNRKEYRVPINDSVRKILDRRKKDLGPLFRFKCQTWVSQKFRHYADMAGLDCRFHDLRHTFGTSLVTAGVDIMTIKELMRHESLTSTLVYAKVLPSQLVAASALIQFDVKLRAVPE